MILDRKFFILYDNVKEQFFRQCYQGHRLKNGHSSMNCGWIIQKHLGFRWCKMLFVIIAFFLALLPRCFSKLYSILLRITSPFVSEPFVSKKKAASACSVPSRGTGHANRVGLWQLLDCARFEEDSCCALRRMWSSALPTLLIGRRVVGRA